MKLNIINTPKSVCVITPTIGQNTLTQCTESVHKQTYKNLTHLVVIDGPEFFEKTFQHCSIPHEDSRLRLTCNPYNTGKNGFYGHRIFSAYPHLVNEDYIFFLDEDNWYSEDHVSSLVDLMERKRLDWAHSLRKVYNNDVYLADDCCEAIGRWPIWFTQGTPDQRHLVDTSTFCFKREFLIKVCQAWHSGWGGDRKFLDFIIKAGYTNYETTGLHTLHYRLPDMNKAYGGQTDFFHRGNEAVKQHYGEYPWKALSS